MKSTAKANDRKSLLYAASLAMAYMCQGLDFAEIDTRNGEARVRVKPRLIDEAKSSFIAGVGLLAGLGWRQGRLGHEAAVADIVGSWREEAEYAAENGLDDMGPSNLFDTRGELAVSAHAGLAFLLANHELVNEGANFVEAVGRHISYSAFASVFLDRIAAPGLGHLAEAMMAFEPHDRELREIGSMVGALQVGAERFG